MMDVSLPDILKGKFTLHTYLPSSTLLNFFCSRMIKALTHETDISHGKEPTDLPEFKLLWYETGTNSITAACTGPDEGLTGVKRSRLHLSAGPDIDFIDTNHDQDIECRKSASKPPKIYSKFRPDQNANKPFTRSRKLTASKGSTSATIPVSITLDQQPKIESSSGINQKQEPKIEKATINVVVSLISTATVAKPIGPMETNQKVTITKTTLQHTDTLNKNTDAPKERPSLSKPGVPLSHHDSYFPLSNDNGQGAEENTISILHNDLTATEHTMELPGRIAGVSNWKLENDHAYGLSVSLYEKNFITNDQVGNPVADCYGLVVRGNAAAMALADGVNWGKLIKTYI